MINKTLLIKWSCTLAIQNVFELLRWEPSKCEARRVGRSFSRRRLYFHQLGTVYTAVIIGYLPRRYPTVSPICIFRYNRLFAFYYELIIQLCPRLWVDFRGGKLDLMRDLMNQFCYEWPSDAKPIQHARYLLLTV